MDNYTRLHDAMNERYQKVLEYITKEAKLDNKRYCDRSLLIWFGDNDHYWIEEKQSDIAEKLGVNTTDVTRALQFLTNSRVVRKIRRGIFVVNKDVLNSENENLIL